MANKIEGLSNQHLMLLNLITSVHSFKYSLAPHPSKEEMDEAIRITGLDYYSIILEYFDAVLEDLSIEEIQGFFEERFSCYLNLEVDQSHLNHLLSHKLIKMNKTSYGKKRPGISSYILGSESENELFFLEFEIGRKIWNFWHELNLQFAVPTSAGRKITLEIGKTIILSSKPVWAKNKKNSKRYLLPKDMISNIRN